MTQSERNMFIFSADHEFEWLMRRLGYEPYSLQAFNLTAKLVAYLREMQSLWDAR